MRATRWIRGTAATALLALASCSGGGDSGGVSVTVDKTSLSFVSVGGPASEAVRFTLTGGSGTYYAAIVVDRANTLAADVLFDTRTTAIVVLTTTSPPPGVTTGSVRFLLCGDSACNAIAWERSLPYEIGVFDVGTGSLSFAAVEGTGAAEPQAIAVDPVDDRHLLTFGADSPWLTVGRDASSGVVVTASASALAAGSYQGHVEIGPPAGAGARKTIPVSFDVATAIVPPPDATVTLDLAGSLTGSLPVAFRGGRAPSWSATADRAWLQLTQATGTGAGAIMYAIDTTKVDGVANWSSDVATVQITAPGVTPVTTRLTLEKRLPEITSVSPLALAAGRAGTLHAFGRGLAQLAAADGISVSGANGVVTTVPAASDREAVIAVPALAEGRATVSVPNPFGIPTRTADVAVSAAGGWTAAMVAAPGEIRSAFFDPFRNAVYAVNTGQGTVVRYRLVSGTWQVDSVPVASIGDLGPSLDRGTLYVTSGEATYCTGTLRTLDPDTLQAGASWPLSSRGGECLLTGRLRTPGLQVTNDERIWFGGSQWSTVMFFDPVAGAFAGHSGPTVLTPSTSMLSGPAYLASPDGSRMIVSQGNNYPAYLFTSEDDRIAQPPLPAGYGVSAWSRDGRVAVSAHVYDTAAWTILGDVPSGWGRQVSPDGSKVYVLVLSSAYAAVRVDVFDATQVVAGTTDLVKVGEIPITDQAASCGPSPSYYCLPAPVFLVGPRGDVFFLVGNQGLVVLPIPADLAGPP